MSDDREDQALLTALAAAGLAGVQPGQVVQGGGPGGPLVVTSSEQPERADDRRHDLSERPVGAATGVGSLPGTDPREAAATVVGELPELPHLPELPERGVGADMIGRAAAVLVDLAVEVVPTGYRTTARPGRDHRRAVDLLQADLDAFQEACERARPKWVKVQVTGPWTLVAEVELPTGHRVLTDHGAVREFTQSLVEGLRAHVAEVAARTGARVVVQLDEPSLPAVLDGTVPTPSGYGTVDAVPEPDAQDVLRSLVGALDVPVVVHCCAAEPPVRLLAGAGFAAIGVDATLPSITGPAAETAMLDALGEVWDAGTPLMLGLVPALEPDAEPGVRDLARRAFDLADRLGFDHTRLGELVIPTPACGLAGATPRWARRAMALTRELGKAFVDPPETW